VQQNYTHYRIYTAACLALACEGVYDMGKLEYMAVHKAR